MTRKDGTISLVGLRTEMRVVLNVVEDIWIRYGQEAVITAGTEAFDGNELIHSAGSLHPFGLALDFRTNYFTEQEIVKIHGELINVLHPSFDIVVHKTHIHIEYDE